MLQTGERNGADVAGGHSLSGEFGRYVLVSGAGFLVDFGGLALGVEVFGLPLLAANAISFSLGVVIVYFGSVRWVFPIRRVVNRRAEFTIFVLIGIVGLGVNQAALWAGVGLFALPYMIAKAGAAGASFVANFLVRKALLFR